MTKLEYTVRFTTPAFPGNAEQSGQRYTTVEIGTLMLLRKGDEP